MQRTWELKLTICGNLRSNEDHDPSKVFGYKQLDPITKMHLIEPCLIGVKLKVLHLDCSTRIFS